MVNILITRRVQPDKCAAFEDLVNDWVARAQDFPGHLGSFVLASPTGPGEHGVLLRLQSHEAWERFQAWGPYVQFVESVRPMLAGAPEVHELKGMEAWFRRTDTAPPPRWKMATLTYVGVVLMVWLASSVVNAAWPNAPHWPAFFLVNGLVVASLTWVTMPLLVRAARPWLARSGRTRS